jgi:hypothetical protein
MIGFNYNSDSDSDSESNSRGGVPFVGPQITEKPLKEQIFHVKRDIINLALNLYIPQEKFDSVIEQQMLKYPGQFEPNDTEQAKLNNLKKLQILLSQKKGGKRRKSKKYRKSRKQRKTKTKRRVRRSYKYKYK